MKPKKNKVSYGKIETLISQDTKINGVIEAVGTIRIDGIVKGGIARAEAVIIGESGMIEGDITSDAVSLAGKVSGNISAGDHLELLKGSSVKGDIQTMQLSIAEGAHFDGNCTMLKESSYDSQPNDQKQEEYSSENLYEKTT